MITVGVGIDLVDVERFDHIISRRPSLLTRLFTEDELAECLGRSERLAARFAAKEAVLKVCGAGIGAARWRDIEILKTPSGAPVVRVQRSADELARRCGVETWHISLTHTDVAAGAVVVGSAS